MGKRAWQDLKLPPGHWEEFLGQTTLFKELSYFWPDHVACGTEDPTHAPCTERWRLNRWTAREILEELLRDTAVSGVGTVEGGVPVTELLTTGPVSGPRQTAGALPARAAASSVPRGLPELHTRLAHHHILNFPGQLAHQTERPALRTGAPGGD